MRILENSFWKYLIYKRVSWSHWLCFALFVKIKKKSPTSLWSTFYRAVGEGGKGGRKPPSPPPHHFLEQKIFFHVKSENIKSLHVINIWFIYWTRHKWQKVDSFFWMCRFSSKLSYHSDYWQRLCKFLFLIWALLKANNILMCGSLLT